MSHRFVSRHSRFIAIAIRSAVVALAFSLVGPHAAAFGPGALWQAQATQAPQSSEAASVPAKGVLASSIDAMQKEEPLAPAVSLADLPELTKVGPVIVISPKEGDMSLPAGPALDLMEVLRRSIEHSAELAATAARTETARQSASSSWRHLGPQVDVRVAKGEGSYSVNNGIVSSNTMPRTEAAVILKQPLIDVSTFNDSKRLDATAEGVEAQERSSKSRIAFEAASAYLAVMQSRLAIEYSEEYETLLAQLLKYMEARTQAGASSRADLDRVQARAQNARASRAEGEASLAINTHQLRRLIGMTPAAIRIPQSILLPIPQTVDAAVDLAREKSDDIMALQKLVESADYAARAERGRFVPNLNIEVGSSMLQNSGGVLTRQYDRRAMVVMNYNLFSSGADLAAYRASLARRKEQEYRLTDTQRRLEEEIANQYAFLVAARHRLIALRGELNANGRVVEAFSSQLAEAHRPLLDVLDAYQRYYQSKLDITSLLVADVSARLRVLHSTGALPGALLGVAP